LNPSGIQRKAWRGAGILAVAVSLALALSCTGGEATEAPGKPNVLWIVWDTVRADRLSVYGYEKPTTPFLEEWAAGARVYEDCQSTASSTVPSHASMFTGLLPTEHGTFHTQRKLDEQFVTIAELFGNDGYRTYLFAANPHIQEKMNFHQGFDVHEHPWTDRYKEEALRIVRAKISPEDRSTNLPRKVLSGEVNDWDIKASGELAGRGLIEWLDTAGEGRPFFAFLNYMEAHTPYIPPQQFREKMMPPEQLPRSYALDNRSVTRWAYTFGQAEYSASDLEIMGATYDATLLELDELFRALIADLDSRGYLDNTVIVLTADHGEHLSEHHMLDHQYALYRPVIGVPLIVHYPERFPPGRKDTPVVTFDLFPTLLELAGIAPPAGLESTAVSLLATPRETRARLAEYPAVFATGIRQVQAFHADWDPSPWQRRLRAFADDGHKLICATDGRHELYDMANDPFELNDLYATQPERATGMMDRLLEFSSRLSPYSGGGAEAPVLTPEEREMLIGLGYLTEGDESADVEIEDTSTGLCGF